jgi:RNA polymerase sigma factor (sigma-70 family)
MGAGINKPMEASVLSETGQQSPALFKDARAGFLRLQSDERLVALTRRGNETAFEVLISRYRARLLAFSRHMVGSTEDAEDILQEVFVAAYRAMLADDRELNVRPWLYRIARNRSLNHLRRPRPTGVDSMDIFVGGAEASTAERVQDRLELEDLMDDVKKLPETQRTALMLREMGQLSYDQIAEAMETSIPSVKSLLVRARVSLAEASESRRLSCEEVRLELGAVAEGLQKLTSPARRHVADCDRCRSFKKELTVTNRKLAVLAPAGVFVLMKNVIALKLLGGAATGAGSGAGIGAATGAGGVGATGAAAAGAGAAASGAATAGVGAVVGKAAATLAAAAIVTAGATQVAKNDLITNKLTQQQTAAPEKQGADTLGATGDTGGVLAGVGDDQLDGAEGATGATGATGEAGATNAVGATGTTGDAALPAGDSKPVEVIDEENTTVILPPDTGHTGGPTHDVESPGLPTGPPSGSTGSGSTGGGPTTSPAPAPTGSTQSAGSVPTPVVTPPLPVTGPTGPPAAADDAAMTVPAATPG